MPEARRNALLHGALLLAILGAGLWLRALPLADRSPIDIVGGDALEYQRLAEFLLDPGPVPPGNRFIGLPLLLAALFTVLPGSHAAILVGTTMTFGAVAMGLSWLLARRLLPPLPSLLTVALVAVQPTLVDNPHRGLSDEMGMVGLLAFLLYYLRVRETVRPSPWAYLGLGAIGAAMALVRPDTAYATIPAAALCGWRERRHGWLLAMTRVLPVLVLPLAMSPLSQAWLEHLGVQPLSERVGRAGLWMEFMMGRMPYQYAFYKETALREWILGFHTLPELMDIAARSTVRTFLGLGHAVWGQLALAVGLFGVWSYVRQTRDPVLPLAVPFAILPQWGLVYLWPDDDVFRYSSRILPVLLAFVVLGAWRLAPRLQARVPAAAALPATGVFAIVLFGVVAPGLVPGSLYESLRPALDKLHVQREQRELVSRVHPQLVNVWEAVASQELSVASALDQVAALADTHQAYAPTHLLLGVLSLQLERPDDAVEHLRRAVELVPFFVEGAAWLAEAQVLAGRPAEAEATLREAVRYRPDHPLPRLLLGHLRFAAGDLAAATHDYEEYLRLNRYQHGRAITRYARGMRRVERPAEAERLEEAREDLGSAEAGLATQFVWSYLSLDLHGIRFPVSDDRAVYYNLGLCQARQGRHRQAEGHLREMATLAPDHLATATALGALYAHRGHVDEARLAFEHARTLAPGDTAAIRGLQALAHGVPRPWPASLPDPQIVLPLSGKPVTAAALAPRS